MCSTRYARERARLSSSAPILHDLREAHGVITFYHDFRTAPPGRHVLKLCRAEACQAMGSEALASRLTRRLGIEWKQTSRDGAVTIEPVYCLGNCALSPALMIDGKLRGRITAEALDAIVDACRREPEGHAPPGPAGAGGGA
jgi:formate dehydrogenase subunit gamma